MTQWRVCVAVARFVIEEFDEAADCVNAQQAS
jgi:hypothetical protein